MSYFLRLFTFFLGIMALCAHANPRIENYIDRIKTNPQALYAFFYAMPKGGELHDHFSGSLLPEDMLALANDATTCLTMDTITPSSGYCQGMTLKNALHQPGLKDKLIRAWSMKDFVPTQNESNAAHFFASFLKFHFLVKQYEPALLAHLMKQAAAQHEHYLELITFKLEDDQHAAAKVKRQPTFLDKHHALQTDPGTLALITKQQNDASRLLNTARHLLRCDTKQPDKACQVKVAFQYYVDRSVSLERVFAQAWVGFNLVAHTPEVVGINLVMPEHGDVALRDYREQMKIFNFLHHLYPQVPITLHAGELDPKTTATHDLRFHIHDAVFIGHAERIGHGVDIQHEDDLQALLHRMATKPVAVEINLTSNDTLLHVSGAQHPLRFYLKHHIPVVLSTDDAGILRTDLTSQYVEAVLRHHLDYNTLKTINRNALTYGFLPGKSLWQDPEKAIPVQACRSFDSLTCKAFLNHHEKAKQQWALEKDLVAFEASFIPPPSRP